MLLLLDWAGPALACRLASIVLQATAGGRILPRAPHFAACCQAGRRRECVARLIFWRRGRKTLRWDLSAFLASWPELFWVSIT